MPNRATTNSWLFPPATQEAQFDAKWSVVGKKQKHCDPNRPADAQRGDCWDHVALDPEHRLVVSVVVGKRTEAHAHRLVHEFRERTDGRPINRMTSDAYPVYASAIAAVYAEPRPAGAAPGAEPRLPDWLVYATVPKVREQNRVVQVETRLVLGLLVSLAAALVWSAVSWCVNTVFVERVNGADRGQNSRKVRKTYRFSKDGDVHVGLSYFTQYSYNFCWCVRTLREEIGPRRYRPRTPAMAAGLADHVWSLEEWLLFPSNNRYKLPCLSPK
jgi:hypothetical protein